MIHNGHKNLPLFIKIPLLVVLGLIMVWLLATAARLSNSMKAEDIPAERAVRTEAVVTDVIHHSTRNGRSTGTELKIRYTFNDKEYNESIYAGMALRGIKVGDTLQLDVDSENPSYAIVAQRTRPNNAPVILLGTAGCIVLVLIGAYIRKMMGKDTQSETASDEKEML